jgi:hypothetical protein
MNTDGTGGAVFRGPINACALPVHVIGGESVGTFFGRTAVRASGSDFEVSIHNLSGGAAATTRLSTTSLWWM